MDKEGAAGGMAETGSDWKDRSGAPVRAHVAVMGAPARPGAAPGARELWARSPGFPLALLPLLEPEQFFDGPPAVGPLGALLYRPLRVDGRLYGLFAWLPAETGAMPLRLLAVEGPWQPGLILAAARALDALPWSALADAEGRRPKMVSSPTLGVPEPGDWVDAPDLGWRAEPEEAGLSLFGHAAAGAAAGEAAGEEMALLDAAAGAVRFLESQPLQKTGRWLPMGLGLRPEARGRGAGFALALYTPGAAVVDGPVALAFSDANPPDVSHWGEADLDWSVMGKPDAAAAPDAAPDAPPGDAPMAAAEPPAQAAPSPDLKPDPDPATITNQTAAPKAPAEPEPPLQLETPEAAPKRAPPLLLGSPIKRVPPADAPPPPREAAPSREAAPRRPEARTGRTPKLVVSPVRPAPKPAAGAPQGGERSAQGGMVLTQALSAAQKAGAGLPPKGGHSNAPADAKTGAPTQAPNQSPNQSPGRKRPAEPPLPDGASFGLRFQRPDHREVVDGFRFADVLPTRAYVVGRLAALSPRFPRLHPTPYEDEVVADLHELLRFLVRFSLLRDPSVLRPALRRVLSLPGLPMMGLGAAAEGSVLSLWFLMVVEMHGEAEIRRWLDDEAGIEAALAARQGATGAQPGPFPDQLFALIASLAEPSAAEGRFEPEHNPLHGALRDDLRRIAEGYRGG